MWIMWKMWIKMENVDIWQILHFSLSTGKNKCFERAPVDSVDNYIPRRFSPTFAISPAPIVINISPFMQFSSKKFSISSKVGK